MMKILPLKVAFLDVGHGDSIVIILPDESTEKRAIVIDTPDHRKTIEFLEENNVKTLEMVFISHFDADHSKGIGALIKHFNEDDRRVNKIYYSLDRISRMGDDATNYKNLLRQLISFDKNHNIRNCSPTVDEFEKFLIQDTINDLYLSILYPSQSELADAHNRNSCNDTSIVLMLDYKGNKILFTGDLEGKGWASLINRATKYKKDIFCDALKMPHHGAFYLDKDTDEAGTIRILDHTSPHYAIISTAQNDRYKHPQRSTICELKARNITTICTQVTDICHVDKKCIQKTILDSYGICGRDYDDKWCPCSGNILITIDNKIKIEPDFTFTKRIKALFDFPQCL